MGKDTTTTTEEGVAEGSGTCMVLKFAPLYDDSSNFGDYRLIKETISLGSSVNLSTNEAVQQRLYER